MADSGDDLRCLSSKMDVCVFKIYKRVELYTRTYGPNYLKRDARAERKCQSHGARRSTSTLRSTSISTALLYWLDSTRLRFGRARISVQTRSGAL